VLKTQICITRPLLCVNCIWKFAEHCCW